MIHVSPKGERFYVYQLGETMLSAQLQIIGLALYHNGGNRTRAARSLGVSLKTIKNWLNRHNELKTIRGPDEEEASNMDDAAKRAPDPSEQESKTGAEAGVRPPVQADPETFCEAKGE